MTPTRTHDTGTVTALRSPGLSSEPFATMDISPGEFERIRRLILDCFGIRLTDEKRSLVVGRLQNTLRLKGFSCFDDYLDHVENDGSGEELGGLIDHISTNHTFFFREPDHFDFFIRTALPEIEARLSAQNARDVRVWCAGCSAGDEAYSFMIQLLEYFGEHYGALDAGVLATDISERMLNEARRGVYSEKRLTEIPSALKNRYFKCLDNDCYEIIEAVRREVTFRRLNLKNHSFPFKHRFDVISCRNVMIYFDAEMKDQLIRALYEQTRPGGYLFVGHSEALNRKTVPYRYVLPGIYQKEG
ncbi:protein-glutamate O-methyltransferase [Desulfatiferula olefinivorans]